MNERSIFIKIKYNICVRKLARERISAIEKAQSVTVEKRFVLYFVKILDNLQRLG